MDLPTSVEPVNATLFTSGCETRSDPVLPAPVMMLTTPGGSSACMRISANNIADRAVDIDLIRLHNLGQLLLGGRVDGREMFLAVALDHTPADEQAITGLDLDVVYRLGCRRVLEDLLGECVGLFLGDCHQSIVK